MKLITVYEVEPGSILGKDILKGDGQVLLSEGAILSREYLTRIAAMGISKVYISDPRVEDIKPKPAISDRTKYLLLNAVYQLFAITEDIYISKMLQQNLMALVRLMISEMNASDLTALNLDQINRVNDYIFTHSLNVSILATAMGIHCGIKGDDLHELSMGAILHDIGKIKIPANILNKPGKLTPKEWDIIKRHSEFGYEIIKRSGLLSMNILDAIMQHHEKMDGSGYPYGLKGSQIHQFAKIITVADVYDALTSNRTYKKAHLPSEAFEYIVGNGGQHFDYSIVDTFARSISIYPVGSIVKLSTGEEGVIVKSSAHYHHRPTVRILRSADGIDMYSPYEIDLLSQSQLSTTIHSIG